MILVKKLVGEIMKKELALEFDVIKNRLMKYLTMSLNLNRVVQLPFIKDKEVLRKELLKTDEASRILLRHGKIILEDLNDIYLSVESANKGAVLSIEELYFVKNSFKIIKENISFSKDIDKNEFRLFFEYIDSFNLCNELNTSLIKCIDENHTIKDNASSKLKAIRNEIRGLEGQIKEKLLKLISTYSAILSDTNIVYKNGKQVLAVQSAHKYKLGGVIVDESNSGYTSYVEPEAVHKITSKINSLRNEENDEIYRILTELSKLVSKYSNEISTNFYSLLELDFMFSKGAFCNEINGKIASISEDTIKLMKAKHPLIDKEKVVSNDFYLSDDYKKVLIISGPNTGGKSVALKTVGLLSYMNQCGLAIPVDGEAVLPIFDNIYVDIGDNQSVVSSLSTFSSHISNISYILKHITSKSLVLLDEVGAGTDPKEGEALAMAIIDYCHKKNCFLLSSTHYENLKTFAINKDYIEVSSMEFDKANLSPTYHLLKDQIGKSYALEISSRYGISKDIISQAYKFKEEYASSTEKMLEKLENKLDEQNELMKDYELRAKELNILIEENKRKEKELQEEINKVKEEAQNTIECLIKDSKEEINSILKSIKEKDNIKMHEVLIANKKLNDLIIDEEVELDSDTFIVGESVNIVSLNKTGKVVSVNKNKYGVDIGNVTLNVNGSDLKKVKEKKKNSKVTISSKVKSKRVSMELNLIGKRVEEALLELNTYLDKARVMNLPSVRIIHGYGTGRLQKAIHEYLKKEKNIEYHFGGQYDGGMGSTIVEFKK